MVWRESPSGSEGNIEADWGTIQGPGMTWGTSQGGREITQGTTQRTRDNPRPRDYLGDGGLFREAAPQWVFGAGINKWF